MSKKTLEIIIRLGKLECKVWVDAEKPDVLEKITLFDLIIDCF